MNQDVLENYFRDQRVAIVGPSPHLIDSNRGHLIDQYDIVVRVNYFQTPTHIKCDYGSRTDVLFHNFGTSHMSALKKLIENYPEDFNEVQFLACPLLYGTRNKEEDFMSWSDDHIGDVVHNAKEVNINNVPFYWIGPKKYQKIYRELGCQPYSGSLTISVLLSLPIKELFITGFTFYKGGKTVDDLYFDEYKTKNHKNRIPGHGGNSAERSFDYFLKMYKENVSRIRVDSVLEKIIEDSV
tara:strand:- start:5506 stop:6225 length:720 start_codon:yes stop_codon:yes gene_type:complete